MSQALALLEFESVAVGLLAVDRMLKKSPVALLRCGTVHPGRYLALVGGSVASTQVAHAEGLLVAEESGARAAEIFMADPHQGLAEAMVGGRNEPEADTLGVFEMNTSPGILGLMDRILKAVPVGLVEVRLADDLGGRALAIIDGELTDVQEAAAMAPTCLHGCAELLNVAVIGRLDETLRTVVGEGTHFGSCRNWKPDGSESISPTVED